MQIARVVGTVVSTQKHRKFEGAKLLLVQPLNLDDTPRGNALLAVDGVGAGVHEKVLIVLEGRAAGEALGKKGGAGRRGGHRHHRSGGHRWRSLIRTCGRWSATPSPGMGIAAPADAVAPCGRLRGACQPRKISVVTGGDPDGRCLIEPSVPLHPLRVLPVDGTLVPRILVTRKLPRQSSRKLDAVGRRRSLRERSRHAAPTNCAPASAGTHRRSSAC